jgi:shikimate dehydrogenase
MSAVPLTGATRLVGIVAHPASHVQAPRFYNPAFAAAGLDWHMVPFDVHPDDFAATVTQLGRMGNLQGLNITLPHKAAALRLCERLGPEARRTGVVNTMRRDADGAWSGESFDGQGFVAAARASGVLHVARPVVLFGTGGAGTAIGHALAAAGVRQLHLHNREVDWAERLATELQAAWPGLACQVGAPLPPNTGLAINATSLGLHAGEPLPFDPARLPADAAVFDIVAARDTELMAAARALGRQVVGGRAMVDRQLGLQIAFWQGRDATEESMEPRT